MCDRVVLYMCVCVTEWCSHGVVGALACSVVTAALGGVAGAGARAYAAALDARASAALRRLVRAAVAPLLLRRQLTELRDRAAELPDTQVTYMYSIVVDNCNCDLLFVN